LIRSILKYAYMSVISLKPVSTSSVCIAFIPINYILLIFHERALIVRLTFTIKTTRVRNMADFVKPTTAIKLQFWKDTIFFLFIVYRQSLRCWFLWVIVCSVLNAVRFTSVFWIVCISEESLF
jgi:hypothetical protein